MTHKFVVNTENVNEYGYRILTDGIDTVQYMRNPVVLFGHTRAHHDPKHVVGKVIKLYVENKQLIADVEIDESDKFSKSLSNKIKGGYIRMASLFADVIESSTDAKLALPGQTHETVTKCKLVEISIVDIGGNNDALMLSRNGQPISLKKLETKTKKMSLKNIALAFALAENATEGELLTTIASVKLAKENAENEVKTLKERIKNIEVTDAETIVGEAVQLGLIPEGLKASQLKAFESDYDGQKETFAKLIADKKAENAVNGKQDAIQSVVLGAKGKKASNNQEETFDYLQRNDTVKLASIRDNEPEKYAKLAKDYANGVRHTAK